MVVFDNNYLTFLFHANPGPVHHPDTGDLVERPRERIAYLVAELRDAKTQILVPTPALAELLTMVGDPHTILEAIQRSSNFQVAAFDTKAAIETALTLRHARETGNLRSGSDKSRAAVKFDHQIVGIAKSRSVAALYSSDRHVVNLGKISGITVIPVWDLSLPPASQGELFLE